MTKKADEVIDLQPEADETKAMAKVIPIRTEGVLCHYPIHKLSKDRRPVQIKFTRANERGRVETTWKVSPNAEYGHPGELAYKLDTLVINRLIDELRPDIPEVIKIADSLYELSQQLGKANTRDTNKIKNALYQNAFAAITARLEFTGNDNTHRTFEFGSTRYGIVFIGERLPNGKRADAIYLVLNPIYRDVLRHAKTRPLDYGYLKELLPSAQRLYELIAPQIFAALRNDNLRAKYLYSEFCQRSTLTRYHEWEKVKKQLYKIHREHIKSGYLKAVEFEETTDVSGMVDWVMWYTPGRRARAEFKRFNTKEGKELDKQQRKQQRLVMIESSLLSAIEANGEERQPGRTAEDSALIEKLMGHGIEESRAGQLVEKNRTECELWANAWPHQNQTGMENPPAVLASFIEKKRRPLPKGYDTQQEQKEKAVKSEGNEQLEAKRIAYRRVVIESGLATLAPEWLDRFEKDFQEFKESSKIQRSVTSERAIADLRLTHFEKFAEENPELSIPTFEEWQKRKNVKS